MLKKLFMVALVLSLAGMASATTVVGQNNGIDAILVGINMTSGGPVTGGIAAQFGGTVQAMDGWALSAGQQAGVALLAGTAMGPGAFTVGTEVSAMQMIGSGGGMGMAAQGAEIGSMTALVKEPGLGALSATSAAVVNQAEVVNSPAGVISNTNTSAVSTIAAMGPCSTGGVTSCVEVDSCQGSAFVNPCPPPQCPPVCPPCPQPTPVCPGDC
jgi:hypothetical protein